MITRKGMHLAALQLELESAHHVLSVLLQKEPSKRCTEQQISKEIVAMQDRIDQLMSEITELTLLIGET